MTKRFSRYKFALQANNGEAVAGSALNRYKQVSTGEVDVTYTRDAGSLPDGFVDVGLIPFSRTDDSIVYVVQMSNRVASGVGTTPAITSAVSGTFLSASCNHQTIPVDTASRTENPLYEPAKAIVRVASGTATNKVSQITNVQYKSKDTSSYTVPFGRATGLISGTNDWFSVTDDIKSAVQTADDGSADDLTVSFQPEFFRIP